MSPRLTKSLSLLISFCLIFDQTAYALEPAQNTPSFYASSLHLPLPDKLIALSPSYQPVALRGLRFYPDDPFRLDFILDEGQVEPDELKLKTEASVLIKYFLSSLTIPEEDLWVNLSPYEQDKVIPEELGLTDMGKDLLREDYLLKQLTASLTYPDSPLGKEFWDEVYQRAHQLFGTAKIPFNTFNKIWIVPDKAVIYEDKDRAILGETRLKVMLEEDYLAFRNREAKIEGRGAKKIKLTEEDEQNINNFSSSIMKEIILPQIEKEVNTGENFTQLRQIYRSLILAIWFKQKLKDYTLNAIRYPLNEIYIDKKKIRGIDSDDPQAKEKVYQLYVEAYKNGLYNYIKKDFDPYERKQIKRRYYSGGASFAKASFAIVTHPLGEVSRDLISTSSSLVSLKLVSPNTMGGNQRIEQVSSAIEKGGGDEWEKNVREVLTLYPQDDIGREIDRNHAERVVKLVEAIARVMGLPWDDMNLLRMAALLHDLGRMGVSYELADQLTEVARTIGLYEEFRIRPENYAKYGLPDSREETIFGFLEQKLQEAYKKLTKEAPEEDKEAKERLQRFQEQYRRLLGIKEQDQFPEDLHLPEKVKENMRIFWLHEERLFTIIQKHQHKIPFKVTEEIKKLLQAQQYLNHLSAKEIPESLPYDQRFITLAHILIAAEQIEFANNWTRLKRHRRPREYRNDNLDKEGNPQPHLVEGRYSTLNQLKNNLKKHIQGGLEVYQASVRVLLELNSNKSLLDLIEKGRSRPNQPGSGKVEESELEALRKRAETELTQPLCLTPDSLITLADGSSKPLIALKPFTNPRGSEGGAEGDMVLSLNEATGKLEPHRVLALLDMGVKPVYLLTTASGKQLKTTLTHPYLTKDGWKKLSEIKAGEKVAVVEDKLHDFAQLDFDPFYSSRRNTSQLFADKHLIDSNDFANLYQGWPRKACLSDFFFAQEIVFWRNYFGDFRGDSHNNDIVVDFIKSGTRNDYGWPLLKSGKVSKRKGDKDKITLPKGGHKYCLQNFPRSQMNPWRLLKETYHPGIFLAAGGGPAGASFAGFPLVQEFPFLPFLTHPFASSSLFTKYTTQPWSLSSINFEPFTRIDYLGELSVYDIEVEATHNFIAQGIVAHNTYTMRIKAGVTKGKRESGSSSLSESEKNDDPLLLSLKNVLIESVKKYTGSKEDIIDYLGKIIAQKFSLPEVLHIYRKWKSYYVDRLFYLSSLKDFNPLFFDLSLYRAISNFISPQDKTHMIKVVYDSNERPATRDFVARPLIRLASDETDIAYLILILEDPEVFSELVRREAAMKMGVFGAVAKGAIPSLAKAFEDEFKKRGLQDIASEALIALMSINPEAVITWQGKSISIGEVVLELLVYPERMARWNAVNAITSVSPGSTFFKKAVLALEERVDKELNPELKVYVLRKLKDLSQEVGYPDPKKSSSALEKKGDLSLCLTPDSLITLAVGTTKPLIELRPFTNPCGSKGSAEGDMVLSLNEATGRLEPHRVLALLDMGVKPVYRITTESGKQLKTTLTHPYLTKNGWRKLQEIRVGEEVAVVREDLSGGLFLEESKQGSYYRPELAHNKNEHPADNLGFGLGNFSFQLSNAFFKTLFGNFQHSLLGTFFNLVQNLDKCLSPLVAKFISQDFWYSNYSHDNLSFLNLKETYHMLAVLSRAIFSLAYADPYTLDDVNWDKVISIEPLGPMQVYDIEVEATHNFIAQGIVAHNTYQGGEQTVSSGITDTKGGIDLNPQNLEMEISGAGAAAYDGKGAGLSSSPFTNIPFDLRNFQGFSFQILSIQPVKDKEAVFG